MRFFSNGPSIPNDLLTARDEGQVVFFCGAGVSRAFSGLPSFDDLTKDVIDILRVGASDPAQILFNSSLEHQRKTGIKGFELNQWGQTRLTCCGGRGHVQAIQ